MKNMDLLSNFDLDNGLKAINYINLTDEEKLMVLEWRNNDNVRKWLFDSDKIELNDHLKFIENLKNDKKNVYWLIKKGDNQEYIGIVSLIKIDYKNESTYFGIIGNPNSTFPLLGFILDKIAIEIAFKKIGFHTLKLEIIEGNNAILFHKRLGFVEEGRLRHAAKKGDKWLDVIVMGMINNNM